MVRSMVSNSNLPLSLWSEAIKTATYVLNRVPTKVIPKKPFELWKGWKPSLRHVHVWGCPVEVRIYNPQEKKLDSRTVGGYFISYAEKSKRYRFYCPSRATKIVESHNARFLENDVISGSNESRHLVFEERHNIEPTLESSSGLIIFPDSHQDLTIQETPVLNEPHHEDILVDSVIQHPKQGNVDITLRRSTRDRRFIISSYYVVYLQEYDIDIGVEDDPITFSQVVGGSESTLWYNSMKDEMNSMANNQVWDPVELPKGAKVIGCKWVLKTKRDSLGNIERYKVRLVAKGFTQQKGIDYHDPFSLVSKKDSFRIIMALVTHFDMELHQMDVKTTFLNGDLEEDVYMKQLEGFIKNGNDHIVCKLKKSIHGPKQASHQWYLKFHDVISSFSFIENVMDQCIYHKVSGSKIIFLVLYVDDILLASNDLGLLHEVKRFLLQQFDMKDMGEASYVIGIRIERDRSQRILGLS